MCLSSILSFESLPAITRRIVLRSLLLIACVLLSLLGLSFFLELVLPVNLYGGWENQQAHLKLSGYQNQWVSKSRVNVLLFGNSVVQTIDVNRQPVYSGDKSISIYNGGVGGLIPETAHFLLENGFFPVGVPDVVIYVLGPRDLRDLDAKPRTPGTHPFLQSVKARYHLADNPVAAATAFLENHFYLLGIRNQARYFLTHGALPETTEITADESGVSEYFHSELKQKAFPKNHYYRSRYNRFDIAPAGGQLSYLDKIITSLRKRGSRLVLITSPIAPAGFSLFDDPENDYSLFLESLKNLAAKTDTAFYDMHQILSLPNEAFANADHVNILGAKQIESFLFQTVLPEVLGIGKQKTPDFFTAYHPQVMSWYQSVRKQTYSLPGKKIANPGPPGRPTELIYRGVDLRNARSISGTLVAGNDQEPFASITFSVLINGRTALRKHISATDKPISNEFTLPIDPRDRGYATITLRTETGSSQLDQRAYWENLVLSSP